MPSRSQENRWKNPQTGEEGRHHVHESIIGNAVAGAGARLITTVGFQEGEERKMKAAFSLILVLLLLAGCTRSPQELFLEGTWVCERVWEGGRSGSWDNAKELSLRFAGNRIECLQEGSVYAAGTFTIRHDADPKQINIVCKRGDEEIRVPGIIAVSGNVLTLCHPNGREGERPSDFTPTNEVSLGIYRRTGKQTTQPEDPGDRQ
jgi:uncharacterized protein (TIGR03067 family)